MSRLTERLVAAKGDRSIDDIAALAVKHGHKLSRGTVAKYLRDEQGTRPPVRTLDALAAGLNIDPRELRELAAYGRGELGEWTPPDESASLTRDQRDALDQLIKTMVRTEDEESSDGRQPEAEKTSDEQGPERTKGGSDGRQPEAQKKPEEMNWWERRRQRVVEQGLPMDEAADDHPVWPRPPEPEDVSQDPDDWPDVDQGRDDNEGPWND